MWCIIVQRWHNNNITLTRLSAYDKCNSSVISITIIILHAKSILSLKYIFWNKFLDIFLRQRTLCLKHISLEVRRKMRKLKFTMAHMSVNAILNYIKTFAKFSHKSDLAVAKRFHSIRLKTAALKRLLISVSKSETTVARN